MTRSKVSQGQIVKYYVPILIISKFHFASTVRQFALYRAFQ